MRTLWCGVKGCTTGSRLRTASSCYPWSARRRVSSHLMISHLNVESYVKNISCLFIRMRCLHIKWWEALSRLNSHWPYCSPTRCVDEAHFQLEAGPEQDPRGSKGVPRSGQRVSVQAGWADEMSHTCMNLLGAVGLRTMIIAICMLRGGGFNSQMIFFDNDLLWLIIRFV